MTDNAVVNPSPTTPTAHRGMSLVLDAARFAAEKHRLQRRKGASVGERHMKTPYVNHCITAAHEIAVLGGVDDPIVLAAALLHDTVEDTDVTEAELRTRFGDDVANVVMEVTDDKTLEKADRKRLQIEHAPHLSHRARLVKLADKISNVRDLALDCPPAWSLERVREYYDWAARVLEPIRGTNAALEAEFDRVFAQRP